MTWKKDSAEKYHFGSLVFCIDRQSYMFRNQIKNLNFYIILVGDMALFALAHASAYCIRFEFELFSVFKFAAWLSGSTQSV